MSSELEKHPRPDLQVVPDASPNFDVGRQFDHLIDVLTPVQMSDAELRQLWLECQWLKADFDKGVLSLPTRWDLMIFRIARGHVSSSLKQHPDVILGATNLAEAIKAHIKQQLRD